MRFTTSRIAPSLAAYLAPYFPDVQFLQDPEQQGLQTPCLFLQQRYSQMDKETGGRYLRRLGLELTYLEDYHLTDLQQRYQSAGEQLDLLMDFFPYREKGDGGETVWIRAHDRQWRIDLDALHYQFELRERVFIPKDDVKMQNMREEVMANE